MHILAYVLVHGRPSAQPVQSSALGEMARSGREVYLNAACRAAEVNLLRKWYHTKLNALSSNQSTLLEVFKAVDAHSASVAEKHYILRGPVPWHVSRMRGWP